MERIEPIWTSLAEMAAALGLAYQTVVSWRARGIPPARLPAIKGALRDAGQPVTLDALEGVTVDDLVRTGVNANRGAA